jgi:hypothetical protein
MIVCEYFFKEFKARASDEYLSAWAADVDRMADEGWEVVEHIPREYGQWTVLLSSAGQKHRCQETQKDLSKDSGIWRIHAFQQESV